MAYRAAYLCLNCNGLHGWIDHPSVRKVERHERGSMEDIWYCPHCHSQHRTHDGTLLGQLYKRWKDVPDVESFLEEEQRLYFDERFGFQMIGGFLR